MLVIGLGCAVTLTLIYIHQSGRILQGLQAGIALAMALLPEGWCGMWSCCVFFPMDSLHFLPLCRTNAKVGTWCVYLYATEFPVILTVFLALGSWRISKHSILTKRKQAIETLGAATLLCTGHLSRYCVRLILVGRLCR